jgi:hypothetical protein
VPIVIAEVRRLLHIYGQEATFRAYATNLLVRQ